MDAESVVFYYAMVSSQCALSLRLLTVCGLLPHYWHVGELRFRSIIIPAHKAWSTCAIKFYNMLRSKLFSSL